MPFVMKKVAMRLRNNSEYIPLPGVRGEAGPAGPGVPTGGTTGQVLAKASNADNDTEWVNQSGGGGTSDYDDLTDKPSINNVTLSGNKTAEDLSLGTYSKPSGGIPASDLASAVQTSLGKADTALQSVPATYRTAAAQDSIDATQDAAIGVVITGKRPSMAVDAGQYVIVRNSTISGITDGLYTANTTLSPSTDVTAANLTAVSGGGLNSLSSLLNKAFKNINATETGSTTAGTNGWTYVPVTIPDGYRMMAVNSLNFSGTDANNIVLRGFVIENSNSRVTVYFKNTTSQTTINWTVSLWITCAKSDLF